MTTSADSAVEPIDGPLTIDEAAEAFFRAPDARKPSAPDQKDIEKDETEDQTPPEQEDEGAPNEQDEQDQEDPEEGDAEGQDEDEGKDEGPKLADDEAEVEFQVDGETKRVSVKELKRLAGQEAALTRKSQEVAEKRKEAEGRANEFAVKLGSLLDKAKTRLAPYEQIDWNLAAAKLSSEDYTNLRTQAQEAYADVAFLQGEADTFLKQAQDQANQARAESAKDAVKVLQEKIPGWSNEVYSGLMDYAVENGISAEEIRNVVDPSVFVLLHKARQFDQAAKVATTKKAAVTPKKAVKPAAAPSNAKSNAGKQQALDRLRRTGTIEDAAEAFFLGGR